MATDSYGWPTYGTDATGADTYVEVIASGGNRKYTNLIAWCAAYPAILSVDGGTGDHVYVPVAADTTPPIAIHNCAPFAEVHAKNGTGGSNYTGLFVIAW